MTLDSQVDVPPSATHERSLNSSYKAILKRGKGVWVFVLFLALVVALQVASGAYESEFASYPDEPAHYVTSLMIRDYFTHLDPLSPVKFAVGYYHHYPKVAFGHWPPFFYIVQAAWMLLFSASRASIRLEVAFTTALLAYGIYTEAKEWFTVRSAILAGLLTISLPLVQTYTDEEMAESLLALMCFWSAIHFQRYIDSGRLRNSLWFGLFFSLAVLTKGSGWLLALVPVFALPLTRKLGVLLRPSFWSAAALVAVLCLPWQVMTLRSAERGWDDAGQSAGQYFVSSSIEFLHILMWIAGPVLSVLIVIGILIKVANPAFRGPVDSRPAVMFALGLAVFLFHCLVPAGVEDRKMIMAVPALVLFLFAGGIWIADRIPGFGSFRAWRRGLVALAAALVFCVQVFAIPRSTRYGYIAAARFLTSRPEFRHATILVSSDSIGEGLLISEVAMREPHPSEVIVRATKALANVDWNATAYRCLFSTPGQVLDYLKTHHIDLVVVDTIPSKVEFAHDKLLKEALSRSPNAHLLAAFPDGPKKVQGEIEIFDLNR